MGYNSTLVVINDALNDIAGDPEFGKKVVAAVQEWPNRGWDRRGGHQGVDVSAGCYANAASVIDVHHADRSALLFVGGNYGSKVGEARGWTHHEPADQLALLKQVAEQLGYRLVKN